MESFQEVVLKALEVYNYFRSPEATAKLVNVDKKELIIDFKGSFVELAGPMIG